MVDCVVGCTVIVWVLPSVLSCTYRPRLVYRIIAILKTRQQNVCLPNYSNWASRVATPAFIFDYIVGSTPPPFPAQQQHSPAILLLSGARRITQSPSAVFCHQIVPCLPIYRSTTGLGIPLQLTAHFRLCARFVFALEFSTTTTTRFCPLVQFGRVPLIVICAEEAKFPAC